MIAIDAMGGDFAPKVPVAAAIKAHNSGIDVLLVGAKEKITAELKRSPDLADFSAIEVVDAPEAIGMAEIIDARTIKKKSSMRKCFELQKAKQVSAVVSAGHSGAMLALGKLLVRSISQVNRPCIGAPLPSARGTLLLADAGANVECSAQNLFQFGVLASIYFETVYKKKSAAIGLLNIGIEAGKGPPVLKEAYDMFKNSELNFIGNIEGKTLFTGEHDIAVCDGFNGNMILKSVQGAASFMKLLFQEQIAKSLTNKLGAFIMRQGLKSVLHQTNYANYGGGALLGLNGIALVCHGSSNSQAIASAIKFANWAAKNTLVDKMQETINFYHSYI